MRPARVCFSGFLSQTGIEFIIFCVKQGIDLSIFVLKTGYLFLDAKQQKFYKRLLINIRVKCVKQGIKKSEFCLKQGRKISDICLKQGQGMRGRAAPLHPGIYRVLPPPPGSDRIPKPETEVDKTQRQELRLHIMRL